ncbi:hypothetical protein [Allomuricauda sp. R78024]|uniref:hypothetical protein n=1 Tax=Allomuricauda sp. R78024 TaxID=3093867 RepID=UPI0037C9D0DE
MKNTQTIILFMLLIGLFSMPTLEAQYGNRYGNNGYGRRQSTLPQAQETPKKEDPLTAEELVDERMPSITESIGLNPFEEAVVRTTLINSVRKRMELRILNLDPPKMQEELQKIVANQNEELKSGLPEDKFDAFQELQENRFNTKKAKKKKKKKKKSKE